MKLFNIILALLSIATLTSCMDKKADLKSDKGRFSYAVGSQIANNLKQQNLEIDSNTLAVAFNDILSGKKSQLTDKEVSEALRKMSEIKRAADKKKSEENIEKGKKYLEANKAKEGVKVTESGLQYKVIKEGTGDIPTKESTVKVHYKGTLIDGTEFDSSYKRGEPAEFPVGGVIAGWTEALQLMKVGAKYELTIPSDLAYGTHGRPSIPGNSVLNFEVELIEIKK